MSGPHGKRPLPQDARANAYGRKVAGTWKYKNILTGIRRREKSLKNSMAHIPHPRQADILRWRLMEREIEQMRADAEAIKPGGTGHRKIEGT